ncbi:MAG: MBL fold metallo-hydrolase [Cyanobacteriota bacterium]|nr:MBL fold metallo-hydrolase [Cyanobacteriota bacterium]
MRVKLWGTRGSLPSPQTPETISGRTKGLFYDFFDRGYRDAGDIDRFFAELPPHRVGGFGGNTLCVEVKTPQQQIAIDAGTGLRLLGYELMKGDCGKGCGEVHLFFTHFHWDHLSGLPFFVPLYIPGNVIHVYAVQPDLPDVFKTLFQNPYFPVTLDRIEGQVKYHQLEPRQPIALNDLSITPYQLDHPQPCWGYRCESGGKVFSHCVDTEITRVSRQELGPDLPLYQNIDLMVIDAQYTLLESVEKVNWGHGSAAIGLEIAMRESVKRVIFVHHDPIASDEQIATVERQTRKFYEREVRISHRRGIPRNEVDWEFGIDGMEVEV